MNKLLLLAMIAAFCSGCYRMPDEDEYSLIPTTNNPAVTREKGGSFTPTANF